MLATFLSWLQAPRYPDDEEKTRIAGMLHIILLVLLGAIIAAILLAAIRSDVITNSTFFRLSLLTGPTSILILFVLLRKGYVQLAAWLLIVFQWVSTVTQVIGSGGLESPALSGFLVTLLLAGFLIGERATYLFGLLSLAGILTVWQLENTSHLPTVYVFSAASVKVFFIVTVLTVTAALLSLVLRTFNEALLHAHAYGRDLEHVLRQKTLTEAALQRFTERLEILHEIDRSLLAARSVHDIAKSALTRIRQLIPCPRASATLFDLQARQASFLAADFDGMETIPHTPIPLEEFGLNVIEVLQRNKPWFTDSMLSDPQATDLDRRLIKEYGIHAWLSLPLLYQGQLIGALNLGRRAGQRFTAEDAEIAHDIANQLAIALQQTRLYNALQDQLAEREKLISELEASNAELERFTYTVSHDLRNPLVTIKGFLGMLQQDLNNGRTDKVQDDFRRIAGAADKMDALLSELLELSRIGRIVNPPEEVNLTDLTREALETLDARLRSSQVSVHISPELPAVYGDRIRLREVLENLIDNAAKYMGSQPNPTIEIGVRTQEEEPIIFVKDNGIGIEASYHDRIFHLFEKLNPRIDGSGIGLALVKRIIELHGGQIWVESEGMGKGSTFCFTIPYAAT